MRKGGFLVKEKRLNDSQNILTLGEDRTHRSGGLVCTTGLRKCWQTAEKVERGLEDFIEIQMEKAASMKNFFCGLPYLVVHADKASQTMNAWEMTIFGMASGEAKKEG